MKSYDDKTSEFIDRVFERSDEILRQSRIQANENASEQADDTPMPCERKSSKIHRFSYAIPGLCAAVVIGLCIRNISKLSIGHDKDHNDIYQNSTSDTTTENIITTTGTTIVTETGSITSTSSTTTTTATVTTASEPATTTDIEETSDESDKPEDPIENTEGPEDIPVIPEEPTVPATKAVVQPTLCGDVNGDKLIDIEDAVLIINYVNNKDSITWAECYKKNKASNSKLTAEQALANADAFKASDKREITREDAEAILGYINGQYPNLPIDELIEDD